MCLSVPWSLRSLKLFVAGSVKHFAHKLVQSQPSLLDLKLQAPQLDFLALDVFVELTVATTNSHHDCVHLEVGLDDASAEEVLAILDHFDWHPDIELFDQLSETLVALVSLFRCIVDCLVEEGLGACRYNSIGVHVTD